MQHVCHSGGASLPVFRLSRMDLKSRLGLVFRVLAEVLMYSASLTLFLYQFASCSKYWCLVPLDAVACVPTHVRQWHCWCRHALALCLVSWFHDRNIVYLMCHSDFCLHVFIIYLIIRLLAVLHKFWSWDQHHLTIASSLHAIEKGYIAQSYYMHTVVSRKQLATTLNASSFWRAHIRSIQWLANGIDVKRPERRSIIGININRPGRRSWRPLNHKCHISGRASYSSDIRKRSTLWSEERNNIYQEVFPIITDSDSLGIPEMWPRISEKVDN